MKTNQFQDRIQHDPNTQAHRGGRKDEWCPLSPIAFPPSSSLSVKRVKFLATHIHNREWGNSLSLSLSPSFGERSVKSSYLLLLSREREGVCVCVWMDVRERSILFSVKGQSSHPTSAVEGEGDGLVKSSLLFLYPGIFCLPLSPSLSLSLSLSLSHIAGKRIQIERKEEDDTPRCT